MFLAKGICCYYGLKTNMAKQLNFVTDYLQEKETLITTVGHPLTPGSMCAMH